MAHGWHIGLFHYPRSAIIAWPVVLEEAPGHEGYCQVSLSVEICSPAVVVVLSWRDIEARCFEFRAWSWQVHHLPQSAATWWPATRPIAEGPSVPLVVAAAKNAFWQLGMSSLVLVAAHLQIPLSPGDSLLDVLVTMVSHTLNLTTVEALTLVEKRLVVLENSTDFVSELMDIDEAAKVFTQEDEQRLKQEQSSAADRQAHAAEFARNFSERRSRAGGAAPKAGARGGSRRGAQPSRRSLPVVGQCRMTQSEAKQWLPGGAFLWKANTQGGLVRAPTAPSSDIAAMAPAW